MKEEFTVKTKMLMQLYYSRLSEKDRRHYAALESLKLGRGGVAYISKLLRIDKSTIVIGRKELESAEKFSIPAGKQRKPGGGRKKNGKPS